MSNNVTPISNIGEYYSYFRNLAVKHPQIQHNPLAETGNGKPGELRFSRWKAEEAITGLRTAVGATCLLIEPYEIITKSEIVCDVKLSHTGAFTVLNTCKINDAADEERASIFCEEILFDCLNKIYEHHYINTNRCLSYFEYFDFNQLEIIEVGPILDNKVGWRCQFNFLLSHFKIDGYQFNNNFLP